MPARRTARSRSYSPTPQETSTTRKHFGTVVAPPATHDDVGQPHLLPIIFRDDPALHAGVEQLDEFAIGVGPRSPEEAAQVG